MRPSFAALVVAWFLIGEALGQADHRKHKAFAVGRAKKAIISTFDPALPNLSLESFLNYETDGALIAWRPFRCDAGRGRARPDDDTKTCVDIYSDLDRSRTIHVILAIPSKGSAPPELRSVSFIEDGLEHPMKLIELPAALHGRQFKVQVPRHLLPLQRVG
jgi:hypothetical protein